MDRPIKDLLDNVVERLEKIGKSQEDQVRKQSQVDQILERLDTIHNRLERQNQKQNALEGKLKDVSNQLEQEKVFMRDQLQGAQNEILRRLTEILEKGEEIIKIHGPSNQEGLDVSTKPGDTDTGTKQHSINTSLDEFDKEDQRPVHDLIRTDFDQLKKSLKDTLYENQQNLGKEISRNTEIVSAQLHDFREMTKVQLLEQKAGMNVKLDNITAANEDLRRQMFTCEGKLTTAEQRAEQHVKDGVMLAVNELRNSAVTYLKTFFTKKTLVCLLLFSAVVLAVWYRSKDLTSVKSQIIHQMDNTKAELISVTTDGTQHIIGKLDDIGFSSWHISDMEYAKHLEDTKSELVTMTSESTQQIMDKLDNLDFKHWDVHYKEYTTHLEDIKAELINIKRVTTQLTLDKQQHAAHKSCNALTQQVLDRLQSISGDGLATVKSQVIQHIDNLKYELVSITNVSQTKMDDLKDKIVSMAVESTLNLKDIKDTIMSTTKASERRLEDIRYKIVSMADEGKIQMEDIQAELVSRSMTNKGKKHIEEIRENIISMFKKEIQQIRTDLLDLANGTIELSRALKRQADSNFEKLRNTIIFTKRNMVSFIEKETQLVRDRIAGPLPSRQTYVCDFYVENFQQLVKTGREVTSLPWHINQYGTSVSGRVYFLNGEMTVRLINARNPREVGLEPKLYGRLKFKATITDTSGGLPDLVVGEETMTIDENLIKNNAYWGVDAGVLSCDELIKKGYGEKQGYGYGALLIRYEITVL